MATTTVRSGFLAVLSAVILAACGGSGREEAVANIDGAGGVVELAGAGVRVEIPAGAVAAGAVEFRVIEREARGALRSVEVRTSGDKLAAPFHVRFDRPAGVPATADLRVVKVDDHGGRTETTDDKGGHGEAEPGDDHGSDDSVSGSGDDDGAFELVEAGDDHGGSGAEPGDDNGGRRSGSAEPDDDSSASSSSSHQRGRSSSSPRPASSASADDRGRNRGSGSGKGSSGGSGGATSGGHGGHSGGGHGGDDGPNHS